MNLNLKNGLINLILVAIYALIGFLTANEGLNSTSILFIGLGLTLSIFIISIFVKKPISVVVNFLAVIIISILALTFSYIDLRMNISIASLGASYGLYLIMLLVLGIKE